MAEIFIYPSYYEGFGLPPLEAMAIGTPVITSNISSLPEIVKDGAVMVDPNNIMEITDSISQILDDNMLKNRLRVKSREIAGKFSWKKSAEHYLKLFNN